MITHIFSQFKDSKYFCNDKNWPILCHDVIELLLGFVPQKIRVDARLTRPHQKGWHKVSIVDREDEIISGDYDFSIKNKCFFSHSRLREEVNDHGLNKTNCFWVRVRPV